MKNTILFLALLIVSSVTSSQSKIADKITALNKEMEQAFNSNDMLKVSTLYLDSAAIVGGGMIVTGRKAIDNYWLSLKDKSAKWKPEIDKIEDYDQVVIQQGRSYLSFSSGGQSNVRFILTWKKTGDSYNILYDTFTRL